MPKRRYSKADGYIDINDTTYNVGVLSENIDTLDTSFAYIVNYKGIEICLPFMGANTICHEPGIYSVYHHDSNEGELLFITPFNCKKYLTSNIYSIDDDYIGNLVNDGKFHVDYDLVSVSSNDDIFAPPNSADDTFIGRGLKEFFRRKKINFNSYLPRFGPGDNRSTLDNKRRNVESGNVSHKTLDELSDIFEFDYELRIYDKEECTNPIGTEIIIDNHFKESGDDISYE